MSTVTINCAGGAHTFEMDFDVRDILTMRERNITDIGNVTCPTCDTKQRVPVEALELALAGVQDVQQEDVTASEDDDTSVVPIDPAAEKGGPS